MQNKKLAIINVVGLTKGLISAEDTPYIHGLLSRYQLKVLKGVFPSVTTTAQSAMLTGKNASEHGIVGNGWYFKDHAEVGFWKQASNLVQAPRLWDTLKGLNKYFTCANSFWWYNMYSTVDYSITPRPHYPADGRKIPDLYSFPQGLHEKLEEKISKFPFFNFWGPKAGIKSSQWIAEAAIELHKEHLPNLHLIYLPHLDYNLQKLGPNNPKIKEDLVKIDKVVERLCSELQALDTEFMLVSEYGIRPVDKAIHINKILRNEHMLTIRNSLGFELLDCGASDAFAAADHQIAHVYIQDKTRIDEIKTLLESQDGIDKVISGEQKGQLGLDHERAGDLIAIAEKNAWFTYYYWLDDKKAPDFARTIDIHRKPGYDPLEMFLDPNIPFVTGKIIWKLLLKKLGFRSMLDVIPLTPHLIKGSHGRIENNELYQPIVISNLKEVDSVKSLKDIYSLALSYFK